jgi:hypothetical protein
MVSNWFNWMQPEQPDRNKPTFARGDPVGTVVLMVSNWFNWMQPEQPDQDKPTFARGDPVGTCKTLNREPLF